MNIEWEVLNCKNKEDLFANLILNVFFLFNLLNKGKRFSLLVYTFHYVVRIEFAARHKHLQT